MTTRIAGIDVHKRMLMVVIVSAENAAVCEKRRFATTTPELLHLGAPHT